MKDVRATQAGRRGVSKTRAPLLPGLSVADGFLRHPFDVVNGVRTSGLIAGRHLKSGHKHDRHATAYYGVAPSVFETLVRKWRSTRPAAPIDETTFIDFGAGMGRAVLLAAVMPFRRVVGVELNPTLVRIARKNLTVWRKTARARTSMRITLSDATDFAYPEGPCVAFLFNPFARPVMRKLVSTIARSFANRPGDLDILYVNNEQEGVLETQKGFVRLFLGQVNRSHADAIADHRILGNHADGEYASADYEDCSIWRWMGKM